MSIQLILNLFDEKIQDKLFDVETVMQEIRF